MSQRPIQSPTPRDGRSRQNSQCSPGAGLDTQDELACRQSQTPSSTSPQKAPVVTHRVRGFMPKSGDIAASQPHTPAMTAGAQSEERPAHYGTSQRSAQVAAQPLPFLPSVRSAGPQQASAAPVSGKLSGGCCPYQLNKGYSALSRGPPPVAGFVEDHRSPPAVQKLQVWTSHGDGAVLVVAAPSCAQRRWNHRDDCSGQFDSEIVPTPAVPEPSDSGSCSIWAEGKVTIISRHRFHTNPAKPCTTRTVLAARKIN